MGRFKVYFLIKNRKPIYIGHTKKLHARIPNHRDKDYDCVKWVDCVDKDYALYAEKRWQRYFKPIHNKNGVKEYPVKGTLPFRNENTRSKTISLSLTHSQYDEVIEMAKKHGRPPTNYISWCITRGLRNDRFAIDIDDFEPAYSIKPQDPDSLFEKEYQIASSTMNRDDLIRWLEDLLYRVEDAIEYIER